MSGNAKSICSRIIPAISIMCRAIPEKHAFSLEESLCNALIPLVRRRYCNVYT